MFPCAGGAHREIWDCGAWGADRQHDAAAVRSAGGVPAGAGGGVQPRAVGGGGAVWAGAGGVPGDQARSVPTIGA